MLRMHPLRLALSAREQVAPDVPAEITKEGQSRAALEKDRLGRCRVVGSSEQRGVIGYGAPGVLSAKGFGGV